LKVLVFLKIIFNDGLEQTYSSIQGSKLDIMTGQVQQRLLFFILIIVQEIKIVKIKLEFLIEPEYLPNQNT